MLSRVIFDLNKITSIGVLANNNLPFSNWKLENVWKILEDNF